MGTPPLRSPNVYSQKKGLKLAICIKCNIIQQLKMNELYLPATVRVIL